MECVQGHSYLVTLSQTKSKKFQMHSLFSNPPAKIKSVTATIVRKVNVSNIGLTTDSRDPAMLSATTTTHQSAICYITSVQAW